MTAEEYRGHLCDVIMMVFQAEHDVNEDHPTLKDDLRNHRITPDEYVARVADEILEHVDLHGLEE